MADVLVPDYPNGANYPSSPDAPVASAQSPSMAQQIAEMIRQVKSTNNTDLSQADQVLTEDPAKKRKRMIGTIIAGLAGALLNKNQPSGGLAGAAAAAGGYNESAQVNERRTQALKAKMMEDENRGNDAIVQHVVPKILDIQAKRTGMEGVPDDVKKFVFSQENPNFTPWLDRNGATQPDSVKQYNFAVGQGFKGTFTDWQDRNKGAESTPNELKVFQSLFPNVDAGTPEGRQAFIDLQGKLKSDPYLPLAVSVLNNDLGSMRMTPEQKIQAAQNIATQMRGRVGAAIKYDAQGNRVP